MTDEPTDATAIILPITDRIPIAGERERRDPLMLAVMIDSIAVFVMCGLWAAGTAHDWLKIPLTLVAIAGLVNFARHLAMRPR